MKVERVKLVYFSPTGTCKAVAESIARGIAASTMQSIDVTNPVARRQPLLASANELLIVAVPVYMGRVPALLDEWLHAIQAQAAPTVCVVVYGNRVYDNALLELTDILRGRGCVPVAAAAYIGEHSFSSAEMPIASGRPNQDDLSHAREFGQWIRRKLESAPMTSQVPELPVPGTRPYGGITKLWDVDFIAVDDRCSQCGHCAQACPMGAIDAENSDVIDQVKCITCCACIKNCPQGARTMKPGPVRDAALRLNTLYKEAKKPECFL
jgi:Fe-S-cluster-containing hydrogenase component 2/flavodoxin